MNLKGFGQTLRQLRKGADLTQTELARELAISDQLLSIWERAYQHGERTWQPDGLSVVRLITIFADRLTLEEAQTWATQAGHHLDEAELAGIFPQAIIAPPPTPDPHLTRLRLDFLPDQHLFGVDEVQAKLEVLLQKQERPWLIALDGMGGIGKTSLAHTLVQAMLAEHRFYDIGWISAKQEEFLPDGVLRAVIQPALTAESFTDSLLTQLDPALGLTRPRDEKQAILTRWLKTKPYLVVVDNLETAVDTQSLLPLLQQLANPTKFILTTRHSLRAEATTAHCHTLRGLNEEDTYILLKYEAETRDIPMLAQASNEHLHTIYQAVGGNPLALKLIVGQLSVLPLPQVLRSLRQADTQSIDELYVYIYWQAWEMLSDEGKQTLVAMPLAQEGGFEDVMRESELDATQTGRALQELTRLSLVEVGGDLAAPHYRIHRLTETFLLNEVIKWQEM